MNGANAAPIIGAVVMRARRQIIDQLAEAGATSEATAVPLAPERRLDRKALEFLCRRGLVVEPQPGRYFVRLEAAHEWHRQLHRRAFIVMATVIVLVIALAATAAMFAGRS